MWVAPSKRGADQGNRGFQIAKHRFRIEPCQLPIARAIRAPSPPVIRAVPFDHEPRRGPNEVRDEPPTDRHLPTKVYAELAAVNG